MVAKSVQKARDDLRRVLSQYIWNTIGLKIEPKDVRIRPKEDDRYIWRPIGNQTIFKDGQNISDMPARDCRRLQEQLHVGYTVQKILFAYERDINPWRDGSHSSIPAWIGNFPYNPTGPQCSICGQTLMLDSEGSYHSLSPRQIRPIQWTEVLTPYNFEGARLDIESQQMPDDEDETKINDNSFVCAPSMNCDTFKMEPPSLGGFLQDLPPEPPFGWPEPSWGGWEFDDTNGFSANFWNNQNSNIDFADRLLDPRWISVL